MKRRGFALLAALSIGCGGAAGETAPRTAAAARAPAAALEASDVLVEEEPDEDLAAAMLREAQLEGPARPRSTTVPFDYEALPIVELGSSETERSAKLRFDGKTFAFDEDLVAEVKVGNHWGFTGVLAGESPPPGSPGERGRCPADGVISDARWTGFSVSKWRDDTIEVHAGEGLFHWSTCESAAQWSGRFEAPAIVAGYVYAFRSRQRDVASDPSETLVLVMPPSSHAVVSSVLEGSRVTRGPFTSVWLRMDRTSGHAVAARFSAQSLSMWSELRRTRRPVRWSEPKPAPKAVHFGIDVTFVGGKSEATYRVAVPDGAEAGTRAFVKAALR